MGRLLEKTDARGGRWRYQYNNIDKVEKITDPLGKVTSYTYNPSGKVRGITDANGNSTVFTYDIRGNIKEVTDPLGQKLEYFYDEEENMTQKILAEKVTYLYQYDNLDRLISATNQETGISERYEYDPVGNLIAVTDGADCRDRRRGKDLEIRL